ncbi:MAG: proline--tRNA ligase [Planctomycetes bacterium]|nr:proline--tRNA ligase [Planctomycetota bacterium]
MPTLWSKTLIPTLRQDPADAEVPSHRLMLRAGLIRQLGSGLYTFLPLGWRALKKAIEIVREEMNAAGASEVLMPALEPLEMFKDTKRDVEYGDNLFTLTDRHGRKAALAPTHEEIITELMAAYVESYRQLPLNLYQIQTKYRDEFRPRFGILRSREFIMKDAYSFDIDLNGLDSSYQAMYDAYCRIFTRCGLEYEIVEAESGPIGGSASHEFMVLCNTGEDIILKSDKGTYSANVEKCGIGKRDLAQDFSGEPTGDLRIVSTPDCTTITDLCKQWQKFGGGKLKPQNVLKTLVYRFEGELTAEEQKEVEELATLGYTDGGFYFYWIVVVRGDHEVNEGAVKTEVEQVHRREMKFTPKSAPGLHLMEECKAKEAGFEVGFVGPHAYLSLPADSKARTRILVDHEAAQPGFWVAGANKPDQHVMHFNWIRECERRWLSDHVTDDHITYVADIRNAADGDPSPTGDGGILHEYKAIEVGHVFKLGSKYSDAMGFSVLDEDQNSQSVIMGCYGIGVGRIIAAAIETSHDDNGIIWPAAIAPYQVHIVPIKYQGEVRDTALSIAKQLEDAGMDVLIDDRDERPGVKFNDADLIGFPIRLTIGDKALAENSVEFKRRVDDKSKAELVKLDQVVERCKEVLAK